MTSDPERDDLLQAILPFVSVHGWTGAALRAAEAEGALPPGVAAADADFLFPGGGREMAQSYLDLVLRRALTAAEPVMASEMRVGLRARAAVQALLVALGEEREASRRALSRLLRPDRGLPAVAHLVDEIWHAAGDRSADFSWYTKRASLAAILMATLLYWLQDPLGDETGSMAFFDRRLAALRGLGLARRRFETLVASLGGRPHRGFRPMRGAS